MYYTLLHLASGQEVHELKLINKPLSDAGYLNNMYSNELAYKLKTFSNIRQARAYINNNQFYEHSDGGRDIISTSALILRGNNIKKCSKHTLQPKRYEDEIIGVKK